MAELTQALDYLTGAGRPPWLIFATLECAKSHIDKATVAQDQAHLEIAGNLLNSINEVVDRYQIFLVWHAEALGQYYLYNSQKNEARQNFEQAISWAEQMNLARRAEVLRQYLNLCQ